MLLAIVLAVFALHVAAWLIAPARQKAHAARSIAQSYVPSAVTMGMGEVLEAK